MFDFIIVASKKHGANSQRLEAMIFSAVSIDIYSATKNYDIQENQINNAITQECEQNQNEQRILLFKAELT